MAQIFISIGSNVNKEINVINSIKTLKAYFPGLSCSSVFESESIGFDGNNFYNLVAAAKTELPLFEVCLLLKKIERDNGRLHNDKKFSPRTLDLDLLFFDDVICDEPAQLPRDEITKNAFVLWPLAELAPEFIHPINNLSIAEIWQGYDKTKQKLWKVELSFK
ncbi:2-amino-4-hydroxy-6-hydroxymethyldihydropteridine diphosphokinase [Pseudoalteromonas denitrificans]|uniref:2-amino-4-hydroxy-6-hydroxymethyldihydropteridine diphosphokinase n=1 Tax=Pseudoalteromonas denitrificans DSM 6059 TaxID=1123010 RepID=A0A1I1J8D9_9GAMM|nr:2-amino-4-hydroxy-6-hydroxymethyldihydropteridine diphosphokinase [Pseudoalteromonas denitrificans]SFC44252.1 2-amino-4-hydroxy-6-hydroxymethyldihydropteridinediphosphokinase [Pseudoalteromonas denitrificans DSM 6059]